MEDHLDAVHGTGDGVRVPQVRVVDRPLARLSKLRANDFEQRLAGPLAPLKDLVARTESEHIRRVLKFVNDHRGKAAKTLGITRKELWLKMKKYSIE